MIIFSSKSNPGNGVGSEPVAIIIFFDVIVLVVPSFKSMAISFALLNLPKPFK